MTVFEEMESREEMEIQIENNTFLIYVDKFDCTDKNEEWHIIVMHIDSCNCFMVTKNHKLAKMNSKNICKHFLRYINKSK